MSSWNFAGKRVRSRIYIVEGTIQEGDIVGIAGYYGQCKSPLVKHLAYCVATGNDFMGRGVRRRPVTLIDMETSPDHVYTSFKGLVERYGDDVDQDYLDLYIRRGGNDNEDSNLLNSVLADSSRRHVKAKEPQIEFMRNILDEKPNSLLIIDPMQAFMNLNKIDEKDVTMMIGDMRGLLRHYPKAAIVTIWNLKKRDKKTRRTDPVTNIRDHMDEVSGSGDIINRVDVRLICGESPYIQGENIYVLNGIVRDQEKFGLMLFKKYKLDEDGPDDDDNLAGFRQLDEKDVNLTVAEKRRASMLPWSFTTTQRGNDVHVWSETRRGSKAMPKASFYRLVKKLMLVGWLEQVGDREYRRKV